ncbi:hypothetical protein GCM10010390_91080 [Streptomyces mordarskii]|uniref:Uncharacterized protein n=1 Tax=Streptomyces mordarskii TaxID=1226758 RepID=A0ABN1ESW2_9ACTN
MSIQHPVHQDEPWEERSAFHWTDRAYSLLEQGLLNADVQVVDGVLSTRVQGICPRCNGVLDDRQVHTAVTDLMVGVHRSTAVPGISGPAVVTIDVTCGCGMAHGAAPEGRTGCGVSFRVELEANTGDGDS